MRLVGALVLLLGPTTPARAQVDLTRYVAIGDSLAAGYSNGSLLERHQATSVPALIARQGGATDFQQPLISEPGLPPELALFSILPVAIARKASDPGAPINLNLPRPYNNLGVPGATALDALETVDGGGRFYPLILRGFGSQAAQAIALNPTFITVWSGDSDVSPAALAGRAIDGVTLTPVDAFRLSYGELITTLASSGARIVAANIGDPMTIPFVSAIKPYVVDPTTQQPVLVNGQTVPLLGPSGPLPADSFVTLNASGLLAQGVGIPASLGGTGEALPGDVVLDPGEVAIIRDHLDQDNQAIAQICAQAGVPVVDLHQLYNDVASGLNIGGVRVSSDFLTGGFFSYDGLHPTDLGYALMANQWIATIDANGGTLPLVDLSPALGVAAAARAGVRAPSPFIFSEDAWQALRSLFRWGRSSGRPAR